MKKVKFAIIIITTLFSLVNAYGQETVIRGRVIDAADKTTIIGANVVEYDSEERVVNGTITNVNGDFVLQMKDPSNIVKVSVIGYKMQQIDAKPGTPIMVQMQSDDVAIGEVTVTAEARTSNSLTNLADRDKASSSVKVDLMEMQDAGVLSAADALQGKISGLDIISASGDPGSGSQLVIRGLSSMGNSRPLIVIDGIPQFRISGSFDLTSADTEDISNLINIALQDIKSIEVLKDAASTAVYGSQGADGVLLIETHKGRMGKVQFDYQYRNNLNIQPDAIPLLNGDEYIMLQLEERHNAYGVFDVPSEIAYDRDFVDFYNYSANTDWLGAITKNGISHDHYFSVSGGGDKTRYFTSFSFLDEGGTTINTGYKRFSSRVNLDYFLSRKLYFQIKFNYTSSTREDNLTFNNWINIRTMAYVKAPNMTIYERDQNNNLTGEYFTPIQSYQDNWALYYNPVAIGNLATNDSYDNSMDNTFTLQYRFNDWLTFRETVAFQFQGSKDKRFLPYNAIGTDWLNGQVNQGREDNQLAQQIRSEAQLAMGSPFRNKDHELSGAFTWIVESSHSEGMTDISTKSPSTDIKEPSADPVVYSMWSWISERKLIRSVNNLNYKFLDRYLLQGVLTIDGHSSFGENHRWGIFQGAFVGWRFSNEPFLESLTWLNESMLRASWGVSGRQPSDVYARFARYGTGTNYIENVAVNPSSVQLSDLRWEKISSYDIGIELNLFNDRVFLETNVYEKLTKDMLLDRYDIPYSSGFSQLRYFNAGELRNQGWELMADVKLIRSKDFLWSVNLNASRNINSFTALPDNFNTEENVSITNGEYPKKIEVGEPIGSFFGFRYLGVYPSDEDAIARDADGEILRDSEGKAIPMQFLDSYTFKGGDAIYEDINHDGKIDLNDVVYIGDSNPDFIGGFGSLLKYKSWDLSVAFHYRLGFDIVNQIAINTQGMNDKSNQSKATLRRWRKQGQDEENMLPRAYYNHPANNLGSDRYVEAGDYLRLNNVKLSYRLSQSLCNKVGLRKASIALSARKLFTFTNYSGQDPEVGQNASDFFWIGVDNARTPPPKIYTISVSVGI